MRKFIKKNLRNDENIILEAEKHWASLLKSGILTIIITIFCTIFSKEYLYIYKISTILEILFGSLFISSIFTKFLKKILSLFFTELGFTNKNLIGKLGIFNTRIRSTPLNKIDSVFAYSNLFGKLLGYGTIQIMSGNGGNFKFSYIKNADDFRTKLLDEIEKSKNEKIDIQANKIADAIITDKS